MILVNSSEIKSKLLDGYSTVVKLFLLANSTNGLIIFFFDSSKTIPFDSKFLNNT